MSNTIIPDRMGIVDFEPETSPADRNLGSRPRLNVPVTLQPLHDRVLVRRFSAESALGGIVVPQIAREKALRGVVVAVGPGKKDREGVFHETMVKPGDVVLFTASVNVPYPDILQDGDLVMMAEADILGTIALPKLP